MNQIYISLEYTHEDVAERLRRAGVLPPVHKIDLKDTINRVCDRQYKEFEMLDAKDVWDINAVDGKTVTKKKPYWEQKCPVCGELGNNATRGIPQQVYCKNNHRWTN